MSQPPIQISSEKMDCVHRASPASHVGRLYSLDALRGVAALAVVIRHWPQHFGTLDTSTSAYKIEQMPFYGALSTCYKFGEMAVPFFFCLSGFIFFWLYAQSVRNREVSARSFFILRFSRLIPLHWLTLAGVCILQLCYSGVSGGSTFVYSNFDAFHFFLHLFLCNGIGFENGFSFNGPTWSVSVEVLCYFVFFVFAYYTSTRLWQVVLLLLGFWALVPIVGVTSSLIGFMCGGVAYLSFDYLSTRVTRGLVLLMWLGLLVGDLSYAIYLLHFPLQILFAIAFSVFHLEFAVFEGRIVFILYFLILILLSYFAYHYFEKPCQMTLRKLCFRRP